MLEHNQTTAREANEARQARQEAHAAVKPKVAEAKSHTPRATPRAEAHAPATPPDRNGTTTHAAAPADDAARPQRELSSRVRSAAQSSQRDDTLQPIQVGAPDDAIASEIDDAVMPLPMVTAAMLAPVVALTPSNAAPADTGGCEQDTIGTTRTGLAAGQPSPTADTAPADLPLPAVGAADAPVAAATAAATATARAVGASGASDLAATDLKEATDRAQAADAAASRESMAGHSLRPELAPAAALASVAHSALAEPARHAVAGSDVAPGTAFGMSLAGIQTARAGDVSTPSPVQAQVPTPLTDPGFQQALGYQVSLLARDGIGHAELHLNPADMGPVSVQITMNGDQARVDFGADLAQTRQLLEAGWAELASSLKDAGFTLSGGGVSDHARERQAQQGQANAQSRGGLATRDSGETPAVAPVVRRVTGGVDVYA